MGPRRRRASSASASPTSHRTRSATWCTWISRTSAPRCTPAQAFAEVESTKSVSDVFSPIEGSIVERNPLIEEHPELVNEQPYGDGWLVLVTPADPAAVDGLLDAAAYRAFVEEGTG